MNNVKGNIEVNYFLKEEFYNKTLSPSLLFMGEPYTGKRLATFALAKIYLDSNPIESPYFLSLGHLPREEEWKTFYQLYLEKNINFYFIKNFIFYFMKKFNPQIWNITDIKSKIDPQDLNTIQEILSGKEEPSLKEWEKINQSILKIYSLYPKNISIGQIRALKEWAYSLKGQPKMVFIEGAHALSTSAMNGLLKILEEPPKDFMCILSVNKRSELPATLLSRLRSFTFNPSSIEEVKNDLKEVYQIKKEFNSFYDFFNNSSIKGQEKIKNLAKDYYLALQERAFFPENLSWKDIFSTKEGNYKDSLEKFLKYLISFLEKELLENPQKNYFLEKLNLTINSEAEIAFTLNQNPISFLEKLYWQLKEIYIKEEEF